MGGVCGVALMSSIMRWRSGLIAVGTLAALRERPEWRSTAPRSSELATMAIIDKRTLDVVRTVTPAPGKTAAHVEFDKTGRFVLVSIWEMDGALVIYDAATFAEIKRIPMSRPSGKYNVWNKVSFSDGTSH